MHPENTTQSNLRQSLYPHSSCATPAGRYVLQIRYVLMGRYQNRVGGHFFEISFSFSATLAGNRQICLSMAVGLIISAQRTFLLLALRKHLGKIDLTFICS